MVFTESICLNFCVLYYYTMDYFLSSLLLHYALPLILLLLYYALLFMFFTYTMTYFLCSLLLYYALPFNVLYSYTVPYFLCSLLIHYALLFMFFTEILSFTLIYGLFLLIHYPFTIHYALLFYVLYVHLVLILKPGGWGQHGSNVQFYDLLLGGKC